MGGVGGGGGGITCHWISVLPRAGHIHVNIPGFCVKEFGISFGRLCQYAISVTIACFLFFSLYYYSCTLAHYITIQLLTLVKLSYKDDSTIAYTYISLNL